MDAEPDRRPEDETNIALKLNESTEGSTAPQQMNNDAPSLQANTRDPVVLPAQEDSETQQSPAEAIDELKFFLRQLYLILRPTVACILLSVVWVKLSAPYDSYWNFGYAITSPSAGSASNAGASVNKAFVGEQALVDTNTSVIIAFSVIGVIIVQTFLIMLLFKYNQMKILFGLLIVTVVIVLGYLTWKLANDLLIFFNIPWDYISFYFFIYNFALVGLLQVLYKGPKWIQQLFLIVMSSLMAFSFSSLPSLVTWLLLALLVIWDLIAVLCPYGPLRLLIESSQSQEREIPALLYSVAIWMMASTSPEPNPSCARQETASLVSEPLSDFADTRPLTDKHHNPDSLQAVEEIEMTSISDTAGRENAPPLDPEATAEPRTGLKLGLGDFVFYSVLVGRAALLDWITTVTCMIAVLSGLSITIILLAINRKALPALPISITFGILFYILSAIVLQPFVNSLTVVPPKQLGASGLWLGKTEGFTTFFV